MADSNRWSRRGLLGLPLALAVKHPVAQAAQRATANLNELPANLPRPKDDGGAKHLPGMAILKRLTPIVPDNHIGAVFYPVFPPDPHAEAVIAWLKSRA